MSKEDILEAIASMSVMEIVELIKAMEEKFGVTAAAVTGPTTNNDTNDNVEEEQTEFNVILSSFGKNKIAVIKAMRSISNLGLKEAKEAVESTPTIVKEGISKKEAEDIKEQLEKSGATVEIK